MFIRRLSTTDIPAVAKLMGDAFPRSGTYSWGGALGMTGSVEGYMKDMYLEKPINSEPGCYGMFVEKETGDEKQNLLIGAVLLEPFEEKKPEEGSSGCSTGVVLKEPYDAISGILDACNVLFHKEFQSRKPSDFEAFIEKKLLCGYVAWIATREEYRKKYRIASQLISHSDEIMKGAKNYEYSVAYCVHPISTNVFLKNGYDAWSHVNYHNFSMKDSEDNIVYPFSKIPDEVTIVVKKLQSCHL
jgi:hypothetical protein